MEEELDLIFHALSHQARRTLLEQLAEGPASISELAQPFEMSFPAVSKHLSILESAGLISIKVEGRVRRCALRAGALHEVEKWMEFYRSFWSRKLEGFARYVEGEENANK